MPVFLLFLLVFIGFGCEEDKIRFTEPQPAGIGPDVKIRKDFIGRYFNDSDSMVLFVTEESIKVQVFNFNQNIDSASETGSNRNLEVNIHGGDSSSHVKVRIGKSRQSDSIEFAAKAVDELFNLNEGGIAKYYKGYYFLNTPYEDDHGYNVRILKLTKEGIILSRIASDSVLHLLEHQDFVKKEGTGQDEEERWQLNPTRKQLKKLIDMGLFAEVIPFRRIKN